MENLENFNADEARKILATIDAPELKEILENIRLGAARGNDKLYVCNKLKSSTIDELEKRGFEVFLQPPIAIQKDNLHYIICWK